MHGRADKGALRQLMYAAAAVGVLRGTQGRLTFRSQSSITADRTHVMNLRQRGAYRRSRRSVRHGAHPAKQELACQRQQTHRPCVADGRPDPDPPCTVRARGQSGTKAVLTERLPGFPDGIARAAGGKGGFWVGLTAPTQPVVHLLPWRCAPTARPTRCRAGAVMGGPSIRNWSAAPERADRTTGSRRSPQRCAPRGEAPAAWGGPGSTKAGTGSAQPRQPFVRLRRRRPAP